MRQGHERELNQELLVVGVNRIESCHCSRLVVVAAQQRTLDHLQGDVDRIVGQSAPVRVAGEVAADDP
jgi:hypothetical protein